MLWGHRNGNNFNTWALARTRSTVMNMIDGVTGESDMGLFNDEITELIRRLQVLSGHEVLGAQP